MSYRPPILASRAGSGRGVRWPQHFPRQRVRAGLSATIGNPDELLAWLARAGVRTFVSHGSLAVDVLCEGRQVPGEASAGPNPGGGFYGAPNINVGRINP